MYASIIRKEEFSGHEENCQQNASDLEGSLVTSSRPPGRSQKRPDDRTSNGGVAAQAADGSRRTVGAADERCRRCRRSSLSCTVVPASTIDRSACMKIAGVENDRLENDGPTRRVWKMPDLENDGSNSSIK